MPGADRMHFRFNQPGARYPKGAQVLITLADGDSVRYAIPDPARRQD